MGAWFGELCNSARPALIEPTVHISKLRSLLGFTGLLLSALTTITLTAAMAVEGFAYSSLHADPSQAHAQSSPDQPAQTPTNQAMPAQQLPQSVPALGSISSYMGLTVKDIHFPDIPEESEQKRFRQLI